MRAVAGSPIRALIIGAGSAGLSTAVELERSGVEVMVIDRATVADAWRQRYAELRLNTTRGTSQVGRQRLDRSAGTWAGRDDYIAHLEAVAGRLRRPVREGVRALSVIECTGGWKVRTDGGDVTASHVVIATGFDAVPRVPDLPGRASYRGEVVHVHQLRRLADLAGRRVLVVGAGNSGVDVAGRLAALGTSVTISARTPPTIVPRSVLGVPLQAVAARSSRLPTALKDLMTSAAGARASRVLARQGVPRPGVGPYTRFTASRVTVAVDDGFVSAVRAGRIQVVAAAQEWTARGVRLADGRDIDAEVVVFATGFLRGLEPLVGPLGVLDARGEPRAAPGPVPGRDGLYFAGFRPAVDGTLHRHAADARRISRLVTG